MKFISLPVYGQDRITCHINVDHVQLIRTSVGGKTCFVYVSGLEEPIHTDYTGFEALEEIEGDDSL